jgi:hypothetical protein
MANGADQVPTQEGLPKYTSQQGWYIAFNLSRRLTLMHLQVQLLFDVDIIEDHSKCTFAARTDTTWMLQFKDLVIGQLDVPDVCLNYCLNNDNSCGWSNNLNCEADLKSHIDSCGGRGRAFGAHTQSVSMEVNQEHGQ